MVASANDLATNRPANDLATNRPANDLATNRPANDLATNRPANDLATNRPANDLATNRPANDLATNRPANDRLDCGTITFQRKRGFLALNRSPSGTPLLKNFRYSKVAIRYWINSSKRD
jgi:uncharacterized protein (DUF2237 family)